MIWPWVLVFFGGATLLALAYWQLIVAEGAYLGPRVVALTYDWVARRYDAIKQFNPQDESWFVVRPLLTEMAARDGDSGQDPNGKETSPLLVLDVATGTGRLPLALCGNGFAWQVIGLDLSLGMLRQARTKLRPHGDAVGLVWQDASYLPFDDGTFDAVTCLEALEFLPRPWEALAEMLRVLRPGGVLMVTNRVGRAARILPGRAFPRPAFAQALAAQGLLNVDVRRWQTTYDLAIARKAGPAVAGQGRRSGGERDGDWQSLLRCPSCAGRFEREMGTCLICSACGLSFEVSDGIALLSGAAVRR